MGYQIDLSTINLNSFKKELKEKTLIPSWTVVLEEIDERFSRISKTGIITLADLQNRLKKKKQSEELARETDIPGEYLKILGRIINSKQAKPRKLAEFTWISEETIGGLEKAGIRNTPKLYDRVKTIRGRKALCAETGIDPDELLQLTRQTDLTRIQWVNATFARVLYEAGYDSVDKVQEAEAEELYNEIIALNSKKNLYKGNIGLNDMKICIEAANEIVPEVTY